MSEWRNSIHVELVRLMVVNSNGDCLVPPRYRKAAGDGMPRGEVVSDPAEVASRAKVVSYHEF